MKNRFFKVVFVIILIIAGILAITTQPRYEQDDCGCLERNE